jgi:hypothetical protein
MPVRFTESTKMFKQEKNHIKISPRGMLPPRQSHIKLTNYSFQSSSAANSYKYGTTKIKTLFIQPGRTLYVS